MYENNLRFNKADEQKGFKLPQIPEFLNSLFAKVLIGLILLSLILVFAVGPNLYNSQANNVDILEVDSSYSNKDVLIESKSNQFYVDLDGKKMFAVKAGGVWSVNMGPLEGETKLKIGNFVSFAGQTHIFEPKKFLTIQRSYKIKDKFTVNLDQYTSKAEYKYTIESNVSDDSVTIVDGEDVIFDPNGTQNKCELKVENSKKFFDCIHTFAKKDVDELANPANLKKAKPFKTFNIKAIDKYKNITEITKPTTLTLVNPAKIDCKFIDKDKDAKEVKLVVGDNKFKCKSPNNASFSVDAPKDPKNAPDQKQAIIAYVDLDVILNLVEGQNIATLKGKDEFNQEFIFNFNLDVKKAETKEEQAAKKKAEEELKKKTEQEAKDKEKKTPTPTTTPTATRPVVPPTPSPTFSQAPERSDNGKGVVYTPNGLYLKIAPVQDRYAPNYYGPTSYTFKLATNKNLTVKVSTRDGSFWKGYSDKGETTNSPLFPQLNTNTSFYVGQNSTDFTTYLNTVTSNPKVGFKYTPYFVEHNITIAEYPEVKIYCRMMHSYANQLPYQDLAKNHPVSVSNCVKE
jgi:hypothetical protein